MYILLRCDCIGCLCVNVWCKTASIYLMFIHVGLLMFKYIYICNLYSLKRAPIYEHKLLLMLPGFIYIFNVNVDMICLFCF